MGEASVRRRILEGLLWFLIVGFCVLYGWYVIHLLRGAL